jgi:hypothetical protein
MEDGIKNRRERDGGCAVIGRISVPSEGTTPIARVMPYKTAEPPECKESSKLCEIVERIDKNTPLFAKDSIENRRAASRPLPFA